MADRYWVGGTGTWGSTQTTNWSAATGLSFTASCTGTALTTTGSPALVVGMTVWSSSHVSLGTIVSGSLNSWVVSVGGTYSSQGMSAATVGASVPTASDNVFFNANSNSSTSSFTVTMANTPRVCNNFTASGLDGTMTLAGSGIGLTVSGSLDWPATNFSRTYGGTTTFNATTTGKTVTARVAFGGPVDFDGVGGGWTLGNNFSCGTQTLTLTNGTFDTSSSGNYSVTADSFNSSNSNIRTINLNASTITLSGSNSAWYIGTSTNATLNAGTSTITFSNTLIQFWGGGLTYYNVTYTSTAASYYSIQGANTFNNLFITGRTTIGICGVEIYLNQTINGTFTISASTAAAYRVSICSSGTGTTRTLTCASIAAMSDVDFRDITIAGAHGTLSGTRFGDQGGNTNITFPAAKTVYYRQTGSADWGTTGSGSWSATSGGALDATMFPLSQDTAVFPAATYPASGSTTTLNDSYNIGAIDMSLRTTNTMVFATGATTPSIYGNWKNGSGITLSGTGLLYFQTRTTQTITSAAKTFSQPIYIDAPSGSVTLQDALTTSTSVSTTLAQGTLNLNSFQLSTATFSSNTSLTRDIAFGTGSIALTSITTGATVLSMATATNFTFTGTSNISAAMSRTRTFNFGGTAGATTSNRLNINLTSGASVPTFTGSFRQINFTGSTLNPGSVTISCHAFNLASGGTYTSTSFTTVGDGTLTYNAKTILALNINATGITTTLGGAGTQGTVTLTNGTLDLAGYTLTNTTTFATASGTKNLTFNGGTVICAKDGATSFDNAAPTGFTTTAGTGTGTISMTASSAKTFVGGGSTFNCTLNQGGAGALTITGSNTFSNITNTYKSTGATSILFTAGTTNTFTDWNASGETTRLLTIGSVTAATHTLSKSSGTVSANFLSISKSIATGGATWYAGADSTDGGGNAGWIFAGSSFGGLFLAFF